MKYTMLSLNEDMIMNYMLNFSKVKIYTITVCIIDLPPSQIVPHKCPIIKLKNYISYMQLV